MKADQPVHFKWPVRVSWEDTDAGGLVFYANRLKFFERARTEWLCSLRLADAGARQLGRAAHSHGYRTILIIRGHLGAVPR